MRCSYTHINSTIPLICQCLPHSSTRLPLACSQRIVLKVIFSTMSLVLSLLSSCISRNVMLRYNLTMSVQDGALVSFLKDVMRRRRRLPSQLAADLGVSHATVSRWLSGKDIPSTKSCQRLAEYSGVPLEKVLSIVGHLPRVAETAPAEWPEFRDYARRKYPNELDEDLITMIEDLIERRRQKKYKV